MTNGSGPIAPLLRRGAWVAIVATLGISSAQGASCSAERPQALAPQDIALCESLEAEIRDPSALPLDAYEEKLDRFLGGYCHRNTAAGWQRDKRVRDTGPFTARFSDGAWTGEYHGTHSPVVIWYSPEMVEWLRANRPAEGGGPAEPPPVPDGAVMIKEMFPAPASTCAEIAPERLFPTDGAAIMVRDRDASHDGWFWGWYGFGPDSGWAPDWPPPESSPPANMGFAQYCMNCHASAADDLTFATARNIQGEAGEPLVYLDQSGVTVAPPGSHHREVVLPRSAAGRLGEPHYRPDTAVLDALRADGLALETWDSVSRMPSQSYDNAWVGADGPTAADEFLTSSQCLGCHDAGSTGLQFDMTEPNPHGDGLLNLSPYATWRSSPMGLAGRDPFFFAQLASETETFHPESSDLVQDTCLACHGFNGQRQFHIDRFAETGTCEPFTRDIVNAVPWPPGNPGAEHAKYGALARDGISCTACHRMALGGGGADLLARPENACVEERQARINPDNTGFARTFTGSYPVIAPDTLIGPFEMPKSKPMENALGITPKHDAGLRQSEACGSCHTVHLSVLLEGKAVGQIYEQTTYPEWAFSAYRTGETTAGELPHGKGEAAQSCQDCHMPSRDESGTPYRSKIASIQEFSNFPETDHRLAPEEIDLPVRDGFARHTLVGLNVFLVKIAQQFPDVLGIRTQDPMLVSRGLDPLLRTEQAMLDLASDQTAELTIDGIELDASTLRAKVTVTNKAGHKFPSGVGFRRAFVAFRVLDQNGGELWASGRTNAAGAIVDESDEPVEGEYWWAEDCSTRLRPDERRHQPHYQTVTKQDQVQIFQELVAAPPEDGSQAVCGHDAEPRGALTTSFLSICAPVKDNRLLPKGTLPLSDRVEIAKALGAGEDLARDTGAVAVGDDRDYLSGGGDTLVYEVALDDLPPGRQPQSVEATLYYQATPPFYLQDRFCTSQSADTKRLKFLAGHLNLDGTEAEGWKLKVVTTGIVAID
ncbi:MAG: hypothetical protein HOH66_16635 [Rhodospirillaceae bacterium]|nr:hypothetical protein [Rhodospirillaceae bacterium]MBT6119490.1 hypothetical protein [Rhodospirillaceae bacterium]